MQGIQFDTMTSLQSIAFVCVPQGVIARFVVLFNFSSSIFKRGGGGRGCVFSIITQQYEFNKTVRTTRILCAWWYTHSSSSPTTCYVGTETSESVQVVHGEPCGGLGVGAMKQLLRRCGPCVWVQSQSESVGLPHACARMADYAFKSLSKL